MGIPSTPVIQFQNPNINSCVIDHKQLGWLSCTCYSVAMATNRSALAPNRHSGCEVRRFTGDTVGGTTLPQCAAFSEGHNQHVELHVGAKVSSAYYLAYQIGLGRSAVVQGNSGAMIGTKFRSTGTGVNHAIFVNQVRGGTPGDPSEAYVFDPAADGRSAGWGRAAKGPAWWPWSLVRSFAARLEPAGDGTAPIGPNKIYCAIYPDTEPHVHLAFSAKRTSPFPDHVKTWSPTKGRVNVRSGPGKKYPIIAKMDHGTPWLAYQTKVDGTGRRWYGNHNGNRWINASRLTGEGGTQ